MAKIPPGMNSSHNRLQMPLKIFSSVCSSSLFPVKQRVLPCEKRHSSGLKARLRHGVSLIPCRKSVDRNGPDSRIIYLKHVLSLLILVCLAGCGSVQQPVNESPNSRSDRVSEPTNAEQPTSKQPPSAISKPDPIPSEAFQPLFLRVLAWNVESGGSDPQVIAGQLQQLPKYQIYGLSEVEPSSFELYRSALGDSFKSIHGTHKYDDYLQMIFDTDRLELIRWRELEEFDGIKFNQEDRSLRCPLFAHFRDCKTDREFQIVLNHLARGNAEFRTQQATGLREWARNQTLPSIAIGDFNFDFEFAANTGNDSFRAMLRDNIWHWVRPAELIDSNWYDRDLDGVDDFPDSILDFAFVAGPAKNWNGHCKIIVRDGDFPDDNKTSDHRPLELILE